MINNIPFTRLLILSIISIIAITTIAAAAPTTKQKTKLIIVSAIAIADTNSSSSEVSVVTSDNHFARIHISLDTAISHDNVAAPFTRIKRGNKITCKGKWNMVDRSVFDASYIFIGKSIPNSDVMDKVSAACEKMSSSSKFTSSSAKMDFYIAVTKGNLSEVKKLLKKDPSLLNTPDESTSNQLPLHQAAINGNTDVVEFLIKSGADINATDDVGYTALHCAVGAGEESTVKCLLEHRADVNAKNKFGFPPLHYLPDHKPVIEYLLAKYGAVSKYDK